MDNYCNYYQENYFERTCPQWINYMNIVANILLEGCVQFEEVSEQLERGLEEGPHE